MEAAEAWKHGSREAEETWRQQRHGASASARQTQGKHRTTELCRNVDCSTKATPKAKVVPLVTSRMMEFQKLKGKFQTATSSASALLSMIKSQEDWRWAANPSNCGELEVALEALTSQVGQLGVSGLLAMEMRDLRISRSEEELIRELGESLRLRPQVEGLQRQISNLQSMHKSRK